MVKLQQLGNFQLQYLLYFHRHNLRVMTNPIHRFIVDWLIVACDIGVLCVEVRQIMQLKVAYGNFCPVHNS